MFNLRGSLQASLAVAAAVLFVLGIRADDPPARAPSGAGKKAQLSGADLAARERELGEKYKEFEQALLVLKQRLEKSDRKEDRDRAAVLGKVLEKSTDFGITTRFSELVKFLSTEKLSKGSNINAAHLQAARLAAALKEILDQLRGGNNTAAKREERLRLEQLVKELEKVILKQRQVNARIEDGRDNPKSVARNQRDVRADTQALNKKLGELNKDDKGKGGEGAKAKDDKGEAKPGKGKGTKGEGKNQGKPGEGKKGEGKNAGKGGEGKKGQAKENAKAGEPKADQKGEAKAGAKSGEAKQGDAKGGQKSGEGQQSGAKSGKGSEGSKGGAKGGQKSGDDKQGQAKEGGEKSKIRQKPDEQQGAAKKGQQGGEKQSGAKSGQGGDKKSSQPKSGDSSPEPGQSKSSQSKGGQGSPKSGGQPKSGEQPQGDAKEDNQKQQQEGDNTTLDARKRIQDAQGYQGNAAKKIEQKKKRPALDDGEKAVAELEKAKKKLEDLLRQLREEELERLLTELKARCEKMLAMQIQVYNGTKAVARAIDTNEGKKPSRANTQDSLTLSDDEKKIVEEASKAIGMLEAEGSAVAFHEVFTQVRDDMKNVQRRLGAVDVGKVTQAVEQDIIDTLNEMIKALEKAKQDLQNKKPPPGGGPPPPQQDQKLLDQIAELKMIRAMQMRVNNRTTLYGRQYTGEQAEEPRIQEELRGLAGRQDRIFEVTNKIVKGDNR